MPIAKDIFALREFDNKHILWRHFHNFFSSDNETGTNFSEFWVDFLEVDERGNYDVFVDCYSDDFLLDYVRNQALEEIDEGNYGNAQRKVDWLRRIQRAVENRAKERITPRIKLLKNIDQWISDVFLSKQDISFEITRQKMRRAKNLLKAYSACLSATRALIQQIKDLISDIEFELGGQYMQKLSERLREARREAGLTQSQIAAKIGMTQGGYTQYEQRRREPSIATLAKLSKILGQSTDWLLGLA